MGTAYELLGEAGFQQQWKKLKIRIDAVERHTANEMPSGSINAFGGSAAPSGWLLCDGSAVSRTTYSQLFDAIGTTYGAGDGSTTFNVPNLNASRFPRGSTSGGATGGAATHKHSMQSHTHSVSGTTGLEGTQRGVQSGAGETVADRNHDHTFSATSGGPSTADTDTVSGLPPFQDVRYIVKV